MNESHINSDFVSIGPASRSLDIEQDSIIAPVCQVIHIDTLRQHRRLVYMREWLTAQLPGKRGLTAIVRQRLSRAA
jgi:hypothetical protein